MNKNNTRLGGSKPYKEKPGLIPTIGAYCIIALIALLTIGLVFARSLSDITNLATHSRDNVLPAIVNQQRTAVNLERLGRFAETIYHSKNPQIRRQFTLAAHILSQDSIFEEVKKVNNTVLDAYHDIEKISRLRDKQDQTNDRSTANILQFAPGNAASEAILKLKHGKAILSILLAADKAQTLDTLSVLEERFATIKTSPTPPMPQNALKHAQTFFTQRRASLEIDENCDELWQQVNSSLHRLSDNLSINAAVTADDSFTIIAQKADRAMQTALLAAGALMLALLTLMYLAHRDIVVPIIRYVQGLNKIGQGDKSLDLPKARVKELDDIRGAVERSATLMTQLAERTGALERANASLELEIEEREKIQKELAFSKERAESADRAKSDFLAGMSHEIRTPMNTILGMADLMLEADPTPLQRQYVEIFQSSGEMLLGIINDVLDLSKIEAGEISLEKAIINLDEFIGRTREVVSGRVVQKGLKFIIDVAGDVPKNFIGDPNRLRQVLVNLIDNGVKFTDQGEVRLSIQQAKNRGPGTLTFTVIDSGIGIPNDVQEQIFHQFTQADASTTRKYGGTGLGLSICRRLVELMGGTIHLESSPHQGSAFFFTLDFELPTEDNTIVPKSAQDTKNLIHLLSADPIKILIAEDSDSNQALLELYLQNTTCHLDFASDGSVAFEKFKKASYDLVLMDIQMPIMDGYETTHQIRAFEKETNRPATPIVAVTANAFKEDQERCLNAGCTDYLAKPVSKANLLQCIVRQVNLDT